MKTRHSCSFLFLFLMTGLVLSLFGGQAYAAEKNQPTISRMLQDGKRAWQKKDIRLATAVYQKLIEVDENNAEALFYLARIYIGKNFFKKGVDFFRRAIAASPDNAVLHLNLARVYEESAFYALAVEEYEQVLKLVNDPSDPVHIEAKQRHEFVEKEHNGRLKKAEPFLVEGRKRYFENDFDAALKQFVKVLGIYPTYAESYYFLGNIFLKKGDYGAGLKHLETSRWNAPSNARVQLTLGRVYEEGRQFEDAEKEYKDIIRRLGDASPEGQEAQTRLAVIAQLRADLQKKEEEIALLIKDAKQLFSEKNAELAEEKFKKVVELDVGRAEAYYYLGRIALARNEFRKGGEYTETAVQYSPRNLGLLLTLARIYDQGGLVENAKKYYNRALFYADPESEQAKEAQSRLNLLGEGVEPTLLKAIEADSHDIRSRVQLAQLYMQQKNMNEAIGQLEAIVAMGGDETIVTSARTNLASVYIAYGKKFIAEKKADEAIRLFQQAVNRDENNADAHYFLGVSYAQIDKLDEGINELKKTVELKPEFTLASEKLGLAYSMKKEYQLAMEAYSFAVAYEKNEKIADQYSLKISEVLMEEQREAEQWEAAILELKNLIARAPKDPKYYVILIQVYAQKGALDRMIETGERLLEVTPKNDRIRMLVAQTYMQASKGDKAKAHLQIVSRGASDKAIKEQAENLLAQIERARKLRFSYNLRYNLTTSGATDNLTADLPSSSNLSLGITSGFSIGDARFNATLAPRYSLNHVSQSDSFNVGFSLQSSFTPHYKFPLTVGYSYNESGNLLTEVKSSFAQSVTVSPRPFTLRVPKKYWLLNDGGLDRDAENITFTLSTQASYQDQDVFSGRSIFLVRALSLNTSLRQSFRSFGNRVGSFTINHVYRDNKNKDLLGKDLAYKGNQLQLSLSHRLFFGVSAGLNYRVSFDDYTNRDSDFGEHRRVLTQVASGSLSKSLFKELSASVSYSWTKRDSNLERGFIRSPNGQIISLQPSNFGSREIRAGSWSSSLNFNFRF